MCKRMISRQMVFDTRLVRNEDHVELRVARRDRFLQLVQDSKSQFNALSISVGHDDVGVQMLLLPQECVAQTTAALDEPVEASTAKVPNAAIPFHGAKKVINSAVLNMIVVED